MFTWIRGTFVRTAGAAVLGLCAGAFAASGPSPDIELASVNTAGTGAGDAYARGMSFSKNGRFVAFFGGASDLVPADENGYGDVFRRDLKTGVTELVSTDATGDQGDGDSEYPGISDNGRYIAFRSRATNLVPGVATGMMNVYWRDLKKGTTELVSVNVAGTAGSAAHCHNVAISGNGRFVSFNARTDDLLAGVDASDDQVYVRDVRKGVTSLASVTPAGAPGNGTSRYASFSCSGRHVVFASSASDLVANDTNNRSDVFVRDMRNGQTRLVSINLAGTAPGNGSSRSASISASGRHVAFGSEADDLVDVSVGNNESGEAYVRDLRKGVTQLVSVNAAGTGAGDDSSEPPWGHSLSANGRFVTFQSYATDLPGGPSGGGGAYLRDLRKGTTLLVSVRPGETVGVGQVSQDVAISGNGRMVAFTTSAPGVIPALTDTNGNDDVFLRRVR